MASKDPSGSRPGLAVKEDAAFLAFYDATSTTAYSLALRVAGDRVAAEAACEAAYLQIWRELTEAQGRVRAEPRVLELVREEALKRRSASAAETIWGAVAGPQDKTVAHALEKAPTLGRRGVELAYFAGLSVAEIAAILESSVPELRQAMRETMLSVATATSQGDER